MPAEGPLVDHLRRAERLTLLLDYDGTLVPFAPRPELAAPDESLRSLLGALARRPRTVVHVVSGRDRGSLEGWLGDLPVGLHAEHGVWTRPTPTSPWQAAREVDEPFRGKLEALVEGVIATSGGRLERKSAGVAWHFRGVDVSDDAVARARAELAEAAAPLGCEVLSGNRVLEIRLRGIHKGEVVRRLAAADPEGATLVAVGDDHTDEDMFRALPEGGVSVVVGDRESGASYRVADVTAVRELLAALVA